MKQILNEFDNNILQNIPILREDILMAEDIYGPSFPYFQGKNHVGDIIVSNSPEGIIDKYTNITLYCDHIHVNGIGFLNNIFLHILFSTWSLI